MKRRLLLLILFFAGCGVYAQQVSQYKYYIADDYLLNPGYVGANDYYSIVTGVNQRFSGISASPTTYFLSLHSKVGTGYLFEKDGKINKFFSKFGNTALGFQFLQYNFGPQFETNIGFTYGYHLKLNPNPKTKKPRKLVLAFTPRFQFMGLNRNKLLLSGTQDDISVPIVSDPLIPTDLESNITARIFNADFGALYQNYYIDAGFSALNFLSSKNQLETEVDSFSVTGVQYSIFDSIYSPAFMFNTKLKFLNIIKEDKMDINFIPEFAGMYFSNRNAVEILLNLQFESIFYKKIAGIRRETILIAKAGLNINHTRVYTPTTFLQPYFSIDYKNYVFSYTYSYTMNSNIMDVSWGGSQVTFGIKIDNDRRVFSPHKGGYWQR